MNNRIRVARGDNISAKTDIIEAGQPVYDTTSHTMRVGTGKQGEGTVATTPALSLEESAVLGTPGTASGTSDTTKTRQVSDIFESGSNTVKNATNVTSTVSGSAKLGTTTGNTNTTDRQPDHIFETNSNTVKDATNAKNLSDATGTITDGVTAVTQAETDNSTKVATTAFVKEVRNTLKQDKTPGTIGSVTTNGSGSPGKNTDYATISLSANEVSAIRRGDSALKIYFVIYIPDATENSDNELTAHIPSDIEIDVNNHFAIPNNSPPDRIYKYISLISGYSGNLYNYIYSTTACLEVILPSTNDSAKISVSNFRCLSDAANQPADWIGGCTFTITKVELINYLR